MQHMTRASLSDTQFNTVVDWLYDAATGTRPWSGLAQPLAEAFGAGSAILKFHGDSAVELLETTDNMVIAPRDQGWADHWHRHDLWVERPMALDPGRIVVSHELMPVAEFERSGFYQDWNRHLDIFHMIGSVFPLDAGGSAVIGIHRAPGAAPFGSAERKRMTELLPHLRRAMKLHHQLAPTRYASLAHLDALEYLGTAAFVLDVQTRLRYANRSAEIAFRDRSGLVLRYGCIHIDAVALHSHWRRLVQQAARGATGAMALPRSGRTPVTLLVTPLRGAHDGAALVLMRDPEARAPALALLVDLFGFTRTEAAVAGALAQGMALEAIARLLGIGLGTVRSHLKQVLAKTGTHRQAQLVAMIAHSVAMLDNSDSH